MQKFKHNAVYGWPPQAYPFCTCCCCLSPPELLATPPTLDPSPSSWPFPQERNHAANLEKKQKQIDKQITEWRSRYDAKEVEFDTAQREARHYSTEV